MTQDAELPLGPPPRKAHIRRGARSIRNAYLTLFALLVLVFGGWSIFDAFHWTSLTTEEQLLTVAFGLGAVLSIISYLLVDHPMRRELRLARRGELAVAKITSAGRKQNRRGTPYVAYTFQTKDGTCIEAESTLPARFPVETRAAGTTINVLYDPDDPALNAPILALEYIEFPQENKKEQ